MARDYDVETTFPTSSLDTLLKVNQRRHRTPNAERHR